MLAWTIYITFIGVLVLMLLPRDNARAARIVALLTAIAGCVVAFVGAIQQANPGEVTTIVKADLDSRASARIIISPPTASAWCWSS